MNKQKVVTRIVSFILVSILALTTLPVNIARAESKSVSNLIELEEAVSDATDGDIITLSDGFEYGDATLSMPAVKVTIDGGSKNWDKGNIIVNGEGSGSLTIKNLKMDGTNTEHTLLTNKASKGKFIVENAELYNSTKGALDISTDGDAKTELNKVWIYDNKAINTAPAIWLGSNSDVNITNSTIENNIGSGGGYETGAISSKNYTGELNINNSVFRNNKNKSANTGVFGGGGGAMAMHYFKGMINIKDSIFDGNQTNGESEEVKSTYDGGAIYIFDGRDGAVFNVESTTFMNNISHDDGGAMMIQGTGNPGLTTNITSSTFYNNKAYGLDGANYSGGAIQFFKNGGSSKMTNTILSSTFVGNQGGNEKTKTEQKGGAIGLSGAGLFATAAVTRNDSLFIGNKVYGDNGQINEASNYKDLSNFSNIQAGTTNVINVDKGVAPTYTLEDVMGKNNIMLTDNQSDIKAGVNDEIVKTIPIKPEEIADNTYNGAKETPKTDQRNFTRYKDQGAVEMSWIKYDANEGIFDLPELESYDGTIYYEKDTEDSEENNSISIKDKVTKYYTVGHIDGKSNVVAGKEILKAPKEGFKFAGWSTEKDATEPDDIYIAGKDINYENDNITLYAVWKENMHEVIFNPDGGKFKEDDSTEVKSELIKNEELVIEKEVTKEGYKFLGWYLGDDKYDFSTPVTEDITLIAKWEKNSGGGGGGGSTTEYYEVTYDANTEDTTGTVPVDSKEYVKDEEVTILSNGDLAREGYTFEGWNTKADGTGKSYKAKDIFNITEDTTLYAVWKAIDENGNEILDKVNHFAYIIGYPDGTVQPDGNITRAEVSAIYFRLMTDETREELWKTSNNYTDVVKEAWYNNEVSTLSNAGVIKGYPEGDFKPDGDITRAEFASMTARFLSDKVKASEGRLNDIEGHWAKDDINKLVAEGIIEGYEDGSFKPEQSITRAEASKIVNGILERTPHKDGLLEDMKVWSDNNEEAWYYVDIQEATNTHDYKRETNKDPENWTKTLEGRDWIKYEKELEEK